jgi:hypothetical protein
MSSRAFVPNFAIARGHARPRRSGRRASPSFETTDAGFQAGAAPAASSHLSNAVAATIALGTLSLCAGVALAVLSIKTSMALPFPT